MELKEIKCKNCNASLEVKDNQKTVTCEYCHTKFSIEDGYNKAYDSTKGALDAQRDAFRETLGGALGNNAAKNVGKAFIAYNLVSFGIGFIIFIAVFIGVIVTIFNISKSEFNMDFENDAGKRSAFFITSTLDDIVTNNKTGKRKVEVAYQDKKCSDEECINGIRDSLNDRDYNVSLEYSKSGYVVLYTIKDIEASEEEEEETYSKSEISFFNAILESYAGKKLGASVSNLCDRIVTSNKTSKHIIIVAYNGVEGSDEETINSIRDSLDKWSDYNVSFDYDDIGFIVKANVTNIQ